MDINDIYARIFSKKYNNTDLTWLLSNAKQLIISNSFIYYKIIKELKSNNEINFINKFISFCEINNKPIFSLFRLAIDESFATEENINKLTSVRFNYNPNLYKILIKEVKPFCDTNTIIKIIRNYFDTLMNEYYFSGEIDNIIKLIDLEILSIIENKDISFLKESIDFDFWANESFKKKVQLFFAKHPNKFIKCDASSYKTYKFISKNVLFNNMPGDYLLTFDTILINECDYKNGLDFSEDSIIILYNYYHSRNKIHELDDLLSYYLNVSYRDNILNYNPDKEQLISIIMKTNNKFKLIMNLSEINNYYHKLCNLNTDRVFVEVSDKHDSGHEIIPFFQYKNAKEFYDKFAKEIKQYNFSPLETYLYTYIKTKTYKNYNFYKGSVEEDAKHSLMSRSPFLILNNNSIVCAGYSNFIIELLNRVNISSSYLHVGPEEVGGFHARVLVHIKDTSYNVDGVYIGEVTGGENAINTKPSCFEAVLTKNERNFEKYQKKPYERANFLDAIMNLDIDDKYKSDKNPEFFDIINRPIPVDTIKKAVVNIMRKTNPYMSEDEVIKLAEEYCYYDSNYIYQYVHANRTLKQQLKNEAWLRFCDFNLFLEENDNFNNVNFSNEVCWNLADKEYCYHILISDNSKSNEEIMTILFSNKHLFENKYVQFYYNEDNNFIGIKLTVPITYTGEMLRDIFLHSANLINKLLNYNISKNTYDEHQNQHKRPRI